MEANRLNLAWGWLESDSTTNEPRIGPILGTYFQLCLRLVSGYSHAVKRVFKFLFLVGGIGSEIVDFGPLPGPTQPRECLGRAPAGTPLDLHRYSTR